MRNGVDIEQKLDSINFLRVELFNFKFLARFLKSRMV